MIQLRLFKLIEQSLFLSLPVRPAPFSLTLYDDANVVTCIFVLRFEYVVLFSDVSRWQVIWPRRPVVYNSTDIQHSTPCTIHIT